MHKRRGKCNIHKCNIKCKPSNIKCKPSTSHKCNIKCKPSTSHKCKIKCKPSTSTPAATQQENQPIQTRDKSLQMLFEVVLAL